MGELASPAVSVMVVESAKIIQVYDPSLTAQEAIVLAGSLLAMSGLVADAKSVLSSMKSVIKNIYLDGGLAYATTGGGKFKLDTDANTDGAFYFKKEVEIGKVKEQNKQRSSAAADGNHNNKGNKAVGKAIGESLWKELWDNGKIIYNTKTYHSSRSTSEKSAAPKNPEILRDSEPFSQDSTGRIAVDVKNKEIVLFREELRLGDGTIIYHGHIAKWKELEQPQKNALERTGLIKRNGKIG